MNGPIANLKLVEGLLPVEKTVMLLLSPKN